MPRSGVKAPKKPPHRAYDKTRNTFRTTKTEHRSSINYSHLQTALERPKMNTSKDNENPLPQRRESFSTAFPPLVEGGEILTLVSYFPTLEFGRKSKAGYCFNRLRGEENVVAFTNGALTTNKKSQEAANMFSKLSAQLTSVGILARRSVHKLISPTAATRQAVEETTPNEESIVREAASNESEDMRRWRANGGPERLQKILAGEYENTIEPGQEWNLENPVFDPFGTLPKVKPTSGTQFRDSSQPPNLSFSAQKKTGVDISFSRASPGAYNNGIWGKGVLKDGHFISDKSGPTLCNVVPMKSGLEDLRKMFEQKATTYAHPNTFDHSKVQVQELTQEAKDAIIQAARGNAPEVIDTQERQINAHVYPHPYVLPGSSSSQLCTTELVRRGVEQLVMYASTKNIHNGEPAGWYYGGTVPEEAIDETSKSLFSPAAKNN
ncbi:hypothetical protein RUND412_003170 [Rhizina undulata]